MAHHHFLIWVVVRKTSFFHTWQVAAIFSHTRAFAGLGRERKSKFLVKRVVSGESLGGAQVESPGFNPGRGVANTLWDGCQERGKPQSTVHAKWVFAGQPPRLKSGDVQIGPVGTSD